MHESERHHCRVFVVMLIPEGSNVLEMHFRSKLQIDLALFFSFQAVSGAVDKIKVHGSKPYEKPSDDRKDT